MHNPKHKYHFESPLAAPHILKSSSEDRIVGGNETTIQEYPYQISLRIRATHLCGGSVLSTTRGLTAAHCVYPFVGPAAYSIKAGSTSVLDQGDPNAQIRTISRLLVHPIWMSATLQNDIAILSWVAPLVFGRNVQPVIIPRSNYAIPYGQNGVVSGWGLTRENVASSAPTLLRAVLEPFLNNANCSRSYPGRIYPEMICAGFPRGGRATCQGDSGGPLVDRRGNRFVQIGIVSWAVGCARPNAPSVYARVPHFYAWIQRNL